MRRSRFKGIDPTTRWGILGLEGFILAAVMAVGFISLACGDDVDEEEEDSTEEDICCVLEDGELRVITGDSDIIDEDGTDALCEEEGLSISSSGICDETVCCQEGEALAFKTFEQCFDAMGTVVSDDVCNENINLNPDMEPEGQPDTPPGECTCGEGTLTFEGAECFEDAGQCSGFHSVFCFRDPPPEGDPTCDFDDPEQDLADFEGVDFSSGTEFCAFDCCITLTCD